MFANSSYSGSDIFSIMAEREPDISIPSVVQIAYNQYKYDKQTNKHEGKCKVCKKMIHEKLGTSSNFTRHLKQHKPE